MTNNETPPQVITRSLSKRSLAALRTYLPWVLLILILALAASLRLVGLNWDEFSHNHPDERFLTMVESSIRMPESLGEYFDTHNSPLNPHNQGYGFFVYGTFPVMLVRTLAEWVNKTGYDVIHLSGRVVSLAEGIDQTSYDRIHLVGRAVSAIFDVVSVYLIFLIGNRLYRRRVGLLAALFAALSVLLIQHSHFMVVDPVANAFILAGLYFAIRIYDHGGGADYALFGLMLGLSVASKIAAAPLAGMAALAAGARVFRAEPGQFKQELVRAAGFLCLAAFLSLLTFRVFQPYAFEGPSFFNLKLNQRWLDNMAEIRAQQRGDTDAPYALQWADRTPILFSLSNLILWGLGLPLGVVAWAGWGWALWEMFKGRWRRHFIPVIWSGAYFVWQSIGFTTAMRYQIPVYPTLALMAAWGLWNAWEKAGAVQAGRRRAARVATGVVASITLLWTFVWAFAFTGIYTRPLTRVAASNWIYTHLPASVNVVVESTEEALLEPISVPLNFVLSANKPYETDFKSNHNGHIVGVSLVSVRSLSVESEEQAFSVEIVENKPDGVSLGIQQAVANLPPGEVIPFELRFEAPIEVIAGRSYSLHLRFDSPGAVELKNDHTNHGIYVIFDYSGTEDLQEIHLPRTDYAVTSVEPSILQFTSHLNGEISGLYFPYVFDARSTAGSDRELKIELLKNPAQRPLAVATFDGAMASDEETTLEIQFDQSVPIAYEQEYFLRLSLLEGSALSMRSTAIISESTWDDGLPLRIGGYDVGGRFSSLNQELYWDDAQDDDMSGVSDKLERIVSTLSEGDYLVITSNRQYGTITRVPIRYPLTIAYYRALLGCEEPRTVLACGASAQPGETLGILGYDLVEVFESNPRLGPIEIPDQLAEEAFTVYDHPKVLIFKKADDFSAEEVSAILGQVDLSQVRHVLPKDVASVEAPKSLILPEDAWELQQESGTWSELFNRFSLINMSDGVAIIVWWLVIGIIGWIAFPITRVAFGGFKNGGYPVARIIGLLVVAWGSWLIGSLGVSVSKGTILFVILLTAVVSGILAWKDRKELLDFIRSRKREILIIEALALGFFLFDLFIRLGNPDLWHPSFGGEKPMDFSYLNAVLKSTTFPPYDPWFAGGYINYYYFGFVIVGMPIKLLGIVPSIAYNLVVPTLFSLLALAGYTVAYNLVAFARQRAAAIRLPSARIAGIAAALALVLLGNLGTADMIYEGFKKIGAQPNEPADGLLGTGQALVGSIRFATSESQFDYVLHEWFWIPSRAIEVPTDEIGPITEFPFFTFLYADLHAHMISRPLTVLAIGWILSRLLLARRRTRGRWIDFGVSFFVGCLLFGALGPTNIADYPVYWALGALGMVYAAWLLHQKIHAKALVEAGLTVLLLIGLANLLFLPFHTWYGQGYTELEVWKGSKTSLADYFTVHGLFLFVIVSWMVWQSIRWMAETPLVMLRQLKPYAGLIAFLGIFFTAGVAVLAGRGYATALLALPIIILSGLLLLRPGLALEKRVVLILIGVSIALTFFVEVFVVKATIDRMNTVFKFYLQVWDMLSLAAAAAFAWVLADLPQWHVGWRRVWAVMVCLLVLSAALYPLFATPAKIRERWVTEAPHVLDGMAFMPYIRHFELHDSFSLQEDYQAIRWMQDNVQGTPVILEANVPEYRWGSRFSIYTGLPGLIGWLNHQRQQRVTGPPGEVEKREATVLRFYLTQSIEEAQEILDRYDVRYIVLGRLERAYYEYVQPCSRVPDSEFISCDMRGYPYGMMQPDVPASECEPLDELTEYGPMACPTYGLDKFETMLSSGILREAFRVGETQIFEVVR